MQTLTQPKLSYTLNEAEDAAAVIVAAGSATRMGGVNKQLINLANVPVIIRTIKAFIKAGFNNIVVVTKQDDILKFQQLFSEYKLSEVTDIVCGGATRHESVMNGIKAVKNKKYVLIHDGARPLITPNLINKVLKATKENEAAAPVLKLVDTIKKINKDGNIISTVNREELLSVQTPQGFLLSTYINAEAKVDANFLTDDCAVFEASGLPVFSVEGDPHNIKITTKEDILLAEMFLKLRGE